MVDCRAGAAPFIPPLFALREDRLLDGATIDWDLAAESRRSSCVSDSDRYALELPDFPVLLPVDGVHQRGRPRACHAGALVTALAVVRRLSPHPRQCCQQHCRPPVLGLCLWTRRLSRVRHPRLHPDRRGLSRPVGGPVGRTPPTQTRTGETGPVVEQCTRPARGGEGVVPQRRCGMPPCGWCFCCRRFHLQVGEVPLLSSVVMKRKGLFTKKRELVLTSKPRLIYFDPVDKEKKGVPVAARVSLDWAAVHTVHGCGVTI